MASIAMAGEFAMLASVVGICVCWKDAVATASLLLRSHKFVALCASSGIAVLPIAFYLLEPSSNTSGLVAERVYAIAALILLALVGCPSAIALYFSQPRRTLFWLFCVSTLISTSGAILIGLACMGVAA